MERTDVEEAIEKTGFFVDRLSELNRSTEVDFLALGGRLNDISAKIREIAAVASSSATLLRTEEVEQDIGALRTTLDGMGRRLTDSERDFERSAGILRDTMRKLAEVSNALPGFRKLIKHLQALAVSTKIETAYLTINDKGFNALAEDVLRLSEMATLKLSQVHNGLKSLHHTISDTLSKILTQDIVEHREAKGVLERLMSALSMLSEKHGRSSTAAERVSLSTDQISRDIGEIVASLQFHDITRQQMEHVEDALLEQCKKCEAASVDDGALSLFADVCDPGTPLANSLDALSSAAAGSRRSLEAIASKVSGISREAAELLGMNGHTGSSFLSELNSGATEVIAFLTDTLKANQALSGAISSVVGTMGELSTFVADIEEVGSEIEMIALNARVKAAHTAREGATLDVIAEAIHDLSERVRGQTMFVSGVLVAIHAASRELDEETERTVQESSRIDGMVSDMASLITSFCGINERVTALLRGLSTKTASLVKDIEHLMWAITVDERAEEVLIQVMEGLKTIARQLRAPAPGAPPLRHRGPVKETEERYTMHRERAVHESFYASPSLPSTTRLPLTQDDALGDNIELF